MPTASVPDWHMNIGSGGCQWDALVFWWATLFSMTTTAAWSVWPGDRWEMENQDFLRTAQAPTLDTFVLQSIDSDWFANFSEEP